MLSEGSILSHTALESPLSGASTLKPDAHGKKKILAATVILTSLVDAFSILVIYLLVNFSNSSEIISMGEMELPTAGQSDVLERTTIVKVEEGRIFIEEDEVKPGRLVAELLKHRQELAKSAMQSENNEALIIQADKKMKYKVLSQVVQASNHAGFSEVRFAVIHN